MKGELISMKKSIRSVLALGVSAIALTSCTSKVTFAEFQDAVKKISDNKVDYTSVKFSGKYTSNGTTLDFNDIQFTYKDGKVSLSDAAADKLVLSVAALALVGVTAATYAVTEDTSLTYYTGDSFKVEKTANTKEYKTWNESGLITALSDGTNTIKASWSK